MAKNLGKQFEAIIQAAFEKVKGVAIEHIPDQTMHFKGRKNPSDFIVFRFPFLYYVECKTVHGNTLPFKNITQFDALLERDRILGVRAGVICWWVDKDVTRWLPIEGLEQKRRFGKKSVRFDALIENSKNIPGRKKKIYFDYDLSTFFE